jgi:hypothetical protein
MRCLWTKKVATTVEMSRSQTRRSSTWKKRGGAVEVERGGGREEVEGEEVKRKVEGQRPNETKEQ